MMPEVLTTALLALVGAAVGSFLNVCILRLPAKQSIVNPGSRCTRCARALRWYENVPIVSWIRLRARCAGCGHRISVMYPLVEVATAITFVAAWRAFGPTPLLATRLIFLSALIVLAVTDLRERLLPNAITLPGIIVGLVCSLVAPPGPISALLGVVIGGVVPFVVGEIYYRVRGVDGLGMGDVKMLAMIGAFLGWQLMLLTLVLASFVGSLVGVGFIAAGKGAKYALPFGTFLALGAVAAMFAGDAVLAWYLGFYQ
jgi:leader peptidase (prepilin peptidase) / N-methyltransferase